MYLLVEYPDAVPGKDDLPNYISHRASRTIATGLILYFGVDYLTGQILDEELFSDSYSAFFEAEDEDEDPFFQGIGAYFGGEDDDAVGKEIITRKVHHMLQMLLDEEAFHSFDPLEVLLFSYIVFSMKSETELLPESEKEDYYPVEEQKNAERELQTQFGLSPEEAESLSRQMYCLFEMDFFDSDLFFRDNDHSVLWNNGFINGIDLLRSATGEGLGYGYEEAASIFSNIGIKPPVRLLGTKEANRIVNEKEAMELRSLYNQLFANPEDLETLLEVAAEACRTSLEDVEDNLQELLDTMPEETLQDEFGGNRPTVEDFIKHLLDKILRDGGN